MEQYEEEEYYHGLLPREDIPHLLRKPGDFLLRVSQMKPHEKRQLILSLALEDKTKSKAASQHQPPKSSYENNPRSSLDPSQSCAILQKHYVITTERETPPYIYTIDGSVKKDTVGELIGEYVNSKRPNPCTVLLTPVKRAAWELKHEQIQTLEKLGNGMFGDVFKGKFRQNYEGVIKEYDVAVKVARSETTDKEKIKEVMKEARLMRNFDHPHVIKLYGVVVEKEPLMIVMELVTGGGLDSYLKLNKDVIELATRLCFIQDASWGIEYLHHRRIIHRDLAVRNCLISEYPNQSVKISDFGLSREGDAYCIKTKGKMPIKWLAPDTLQNFEYTQKTDVWTYGVLVWEVYANAEEPYAGLSNPEAKAKIQSHQLLQFPDYTPKEVVSIIVDDCWEREPSKRSSMTMVARKLEMLNGRQPPAQQPSIRRTALASMAQNPLPPAPGVATTSPKAEPQQKRAQKHLQPGLSGKQTKQTVMRSLQASGNRKRAQDFGASGKRAARR